MMLVDSQTNYGIFSVHVQWFSCRISRADDSNVIGDVTMIAHAIGGGKYIRRANLSFRAVLWVSGTEWLGLLLS